MENDGSEIPNHTAVWVHIANGDFGRAEMVVLQLIAQTDSRDALALWHLFGLLASVLQSLNRSDEAARMHRHALSEALRAADGRDTIEVAIARYMLGKDLLLQGYAEDALIEVEFASARGGPCQHLLCAVAAEALWRLDRPEDSRAAAARALTSAPSDAEGWFIGQQLGYILGVVSAG
jgi:hypothetical protein